jgi:CRISPR-associated protein Csb2
MPLAIRVQFLAGYSGREWPPSPARLFKALVSAARAGWANSNRKAIDDSLRALEQQGWTEHTKLPEIVAPRAELRPPRQRRFVPNNSKNWPLERKLNPEKGIDLEPETMVGWDIEAPTTVWYWWPSIEASHVPVLREVSRRVVSVGKGEDLAVLDATDAEPPASTLRWQPAPSGASLEVPEAGCLDVCDAVFARNLNDLPLPTAGVSAVTYSPDVGASAQLVPAFVVGLFWRNGTRCSWDARLLRQVVGPIRHLLDEIRNDVVAELVRRPSERRAMEALALRVLLGHEDSGRPIAEPHLAIMPLPSVLGPHPDGRVRRVAFADFGHRDDPDRRAIVELARVLLHGRELQDGGRDTGVVLGTEPDSQWAASITRSSRVWATVTPLVQAAKELTAAEWRRLSSARRVAEEDPATVARLETRLRARRLELIARSVQHAVAGRGVRVESIEFGAAGPIAGVHTAQQYRVRGHLAETSRVHLRVSFDRVIQGPLAVGRGRHVGFGVLWPAEDRQ